MTIVLNVFDVQGSYYANVDFRHNEHRQSRNLMFSREAACGPEDDSNAAVGKLLSDVETEARNRGIDPGAIQNLASLRRIQEAGRGSEPENADEAA